MTRIYLSPPELDGDELDRVVAAVQSNWIAPLGPEVDGFEADLAERSGRPHAAALSSGTAALHLALMLVGVGPGDDVVVPTLTFAATANAVTYIGANPVLVGAQPTTGNLCPLTLESLLAERAVRGRLPAAVISVDLYGQCADYDALEPLCRRYGIPLIEDAAESLGATWQGRPAGNFGQLAAFSFNGNKIITTSGGGMLVGDDEELIGRARYLAQQARQPLPYYEHTDIGFNYRMSNILAALGRGQIRRLDHKVACRRWVRDGYLKRLEGTPGLSFLEWDERGEPNAWLTVLLVDHEIFGAGPDQIREALAAEDIEARPPWKPMHLQPVYRSAEYHGDDAAERLFLTGLCLPSGSGLDDDDLDRITTHLVRSGGRT